MRNRASDLRISRSDALTTDHKDSARSKVYYEVHMTLVLHTAWISNVACVMFALTLCIDSVMIAFCGF